MTHPTFDFTGVSPSLTAYLIRLAFSVTAVLLCALAATLIAHRASAAVRHRIWSLATLAALLLPAILQVLPEHRVGLIGPQSKVADAPVQSTAFTPVFPTAAVTTVDTSDNPHVSPVALPISSNPQPMIVRPYSFSPETLLSLAYAIPCILLIFRLILGALTSRIAVRRATPLALSTGSNVPVLQSSRVQTPVCVGYFRPAILLPPSWRSWSADQLQAVLTHELAHVARRDVLWQAVARLACAIYWPHPLIWHAARRMRIEREFACDDSVIRAGASPMLYSRWLLDLACRLKAAHLGIAMAGRAGLLPAHTFHV